MVDEGTINRDQFEPFHMTLGQQQPVKGVSGRRFGIQGVEDVRDFDAEYIQTN